MPSDTLPKRRRSEAQLLQKRANDLRTHRASRAQSKRTLERIEAQLDHVRSSTEQILAHLQHRRYPQPCETETPASPTQVDCRCGIEHAAPIECLEQGAASLLYKTHLSIAQNPSSTPWIPQSPTLAQMMFQSPPSNPIAELLTNTLKLFVTHDSVTFFGIYFLAYRLFRWRLFPIAETRSDTPSFMLPTDVQNTRAHPICIDFLPWPALRDYLCLNQNRDRRHSVDLYFRSFRLLWPLETDLFKRDSMGGFALHDNFEQTASNLSKWQLCSPFKETFPQLLSYAQPLTPASDME